MPLDWTEANLGDPSLASFVRPDMDLLATSRWEASGWDPWAELAARPEVELVWHEIADTAGGAAYMKVGTRRHFIVLSPALANDRARAEALTHELCHHQRGVVHPAATAETMNCEERVVRAMTRRRMAHYRPAALPGSCRP